MSNLKEKINSLHKLKKLLNTSSIIFDPEICFLYSSDCSKVKGLPLAVVLIEDLSELSIILKFCKSEKIPITFRGSGTSLKGNFVLRNGGLLICFSKANKIRKFDSVKRIIYVEPGITINKINNFLQKDNYYIPMFSQNPLATIGGLISNNSKNHRVYDNSVAAYIKGLNYITSDGKEHLCGVYNKQNSLGNFLNSAEGTLGVIKEAALDVLDCPVIEYLVFIEITNLDQVKTLVKELNLNDLTPLEASLRDTEFWIKTQRDNDFIAKCALSSKEKNISYGLYLSYHFGNYPDYIRCNKMLQKVLKTKFKHLKYQENELSLGTNIDKLQKIESSIDLNNFHEFDVSFNHDFLEAFIKFLDILIIDKYKLCYYVDLNPFNFLLSVIVYAKKTNAKTENLIRFFTEEFYENILKFKGTISSKFGIGLINSRFLSLKLNKINFKLLKNIKESFDSDNCVNPEKIIKRFINN